MKDEERLAVVEKMQALMELIPRENMQRHVDNRDFALIRGCCGIRQIYYPAYIKLEHQLYESLPESCRRLVYFRYFHNQMSVFLVKGCENSTALDSVATKTYFSNICQLKPTTYFLLAPLHGFEFSHDSVIEIGNYIVGSWPAVQKYLKSDLIHASDWVVDTIKPESNGTIDFYYLGVKDICAIDTVAAEEKYDELASHFIDVVLGCVGKVDSSNVKISSVKESAGRRMLFCDDTACNPSATRKDLFNPLYCFDESFFKQPPFVKLLAFSFQKEGELSEMARKIRRSLRWLGKALRGESLPDQILSLGIAFEALLVAQKGFVTASITSQLSDMVAFLLVESVDDRRSLAGIMIDFYDKRSKIAHGKDVNVSIADIQLYVNLLQQLIHRVVEVVESQKLSKADDFGTLMKDIKYGKLLSGLTVNPKDDPFPSC